MSQDEGLQALAERLYAEFNSVRSSLLSNVTVRWDGSAWGVRPPTAPFGVVFLSTNDAAATAPPTTDLAVGDLWRRHPDAAPL